MLKDRVTTWTLIPFCNAFPRATSACRRRGGHRGRAPEKIDALFHLPLLALAVLVIARGKPFRTTVLGWNVALLLTEHFTALKCTPHALETSLTLRRRCADALAFLEAAGLVVVSHGSPARVTLSDDGKSHLDRAARDSTDLGLWCGSLG